MNLAEATIEYSRTVAVVAGPGAFVLASQVVSRSAKLAQFRLNEVYTVVTAVIALFGAWTLTGLGTWSNPTLVSSAIGLAAGIVLGGVVILADRSIGRSLARHVREEYRKKFASPVRPASAAPTVRPAGAAATSNAATQRRLLVRRPSVGNTATSRSPRALLFWLIAVAVSEEWLYRGVIVEVARSIGGINEELLLIYATVMFALIHVTFGWIQVAAKLPLALATLSVVLVFHSLLPAVIIHVAFNLYYWRVKQFGAVSAASTIWTA